MYRAYRDTVFRLAVARLGSGPAAEDALQEVFVRYVKSAPVFLDEEHRKAWLIRTTVNYCRSLKRSAVEKRTVPLTGDVAVKMKERSEVYYAVLKLPAESRTVIHLFYYEEYPVKEIAELLGVNEATVKSRLRRARQKLKTLLEQDAL